MTPNKTKYPPFWKDDRPQSQILITGKLAQKLSQLNHKRRKPKIEFKSNDSFLFILIGGVPPNPNEFIDLQFPGKVIVYRPPFFDAKQQPQKESQKSHQEQLFNISMDNTCQEINKLIEDNKFSQAIFVYHSFGGSITAWFCSLFPEKVKGLICLGGTPIRFYPILRDYAKAYLSIPDINRKFIIENYEVVYALYDQKTKNHNSWTRFKNKEQLLSFTLHNDPNTLNTLFDKIRKLALPILMIYGKNDEVLKPQLCSEAMIFMSYFRKDSDNGKISDQMKSRFNNLIQNEAPSQKQLNLQQKFVYFIQGGHSIHISQKNNKIIQTLIDQYLYVLLGGQIFDNDTKILKKEIQSKL